MVHTIDLNRAELDLNLSVDVCVIGAGAAGIYLATEMSIRGLHVALLEAGGSQCVLGEALGISPVFTGDLYRGALEGRAFGVGGSTSKWGGLLIPHSNFDNRETGGCTSESWVHIVREVHRNSASVLLRLCQTADLEFHSAWPPGLGETGELIRRSGIEMMGAAFLPFHRRNFRYLLSGSSGKRVTTLTNAVAYRWKAARAEGPGGRIVEVLARSQGARTARVMAKCFVVAAGAIESARILLEIDRQTDHRLIPSSAEVGRNLSDHLSCPIAEVHQSDRVKAAALFGPWFTNGRLRSLRFIHPSAGGHLPRHFAHFIFEIDNAGFRLAKNLLSGLQRKAMPAVTASSLIRGLRGFFDLAYQKAFRARLHVPDGTPSRLQLDVEQSPQGENRVALGGDIDRFGRPMAEIHWRVNGTDRENIKRLGGVLLSRLGDIGSPFPRLIPTLMGDGEVKPHDAYHPVGTCRMGNDSGSTVDLDLRVKGVSNLYVLSTAVFPTAGTANPTFSMLCLGQRLAAHLSELHAADGIR